MESVLGRYRNLTILVVVLFLQVLGLAVQVKRSGDAESTRLIRIWAVGAITPFERALVWTQSGGRNLWRDYCYLRGVRAENRDLKQQVEQMRLQEVRLSEDAEQAHRLQSLLAFKEQFISKTLAAQVIGSGGSDLSRIIYIDKGKNDGLKPDLAVITANGIVGKVLMVFPSVSQVLLINDQSSGVGVMLEKSRLQGVLRGTADGEVTLERVMSDEQVSPGETVLSSGGEQIFPKGLPIGTVTSVKPGKEMFLNIHVKPAADLARLEEVLVVTEKQEQSPVADSGGRVRAADILAARLPSVPDKPVAAAGTSIPGQGTVAKIQTVAAGSAKTAGTERQAATPTASPSALAGKTPEHTSVSPTSTPVAGKASPAAKSVTVDGMAGASVPANSPSSKRKTQQEKPPVAQSNSQPPVTDDNRH
jgi:rod shape-determining protein MreC